MHFVTGGHFCIQISYAQPSWYGGGFQECSRSRSVMVTHKNGARSHVKVETCPALEVRGWSRHRT